MSKVKHVANATALIDDAFAKMPEHIQFMVNKLRALAHEAEPQILKTGNGGQTFIATEWFVMFWDLKNMLLLCFLMG